MLRSMTAGHFLNAFVFVDDKLHFVFHKPVFIVFLNKYVENIHFVWDLFLKWCKMKQKIGNYSQNDRFFTNFNKKLVL